MSGRVVSPDVRSPRGQLGSSIVREGVLAIDGGSQCCACLEHPNRIETTDSLREVVPWDRSGLVEACGAFCRHTVFRAERQFSRNAADRASEGCRQHGVQDRARVRVNTRKGRRPASGTSAHHASPRRGSHARAPRRSHHGSVCRQKRSRSACPRSCWLRCSLVRGEAADWNPGDPGVEFARRWRGSCGHGVLGSRSPVTPRPVDVLRRHRDPGNVVLGQLRGIGRR